MEDICNGTPKQAEFPEELKQYIKVGCSRNASHSPLDSTTCNFDKPLRYCACRRSMLSHQRQLLLW